MKGDRNPRSDERIARVATKWSASGAGETYRTARFRSRSARERDPQLIAALLRRCGDVATILDAPCGAARLHESLERCASRIVGVDASAAMLAAASKASGATFVQASLDALPFDNGSFDVVVCCRFLHHLHDRVAVERATAELVRVSRRFVIASFWDSASLPALRVRLGLKRAEGPLGRTAASRASIAAAFERAGGVVREHRSSFRYLSQQTFVLVERAERAP